MDDLQYTLVRVVSGTDVAAIIHAIQGVLIGDKGDIIDHYACKQLYVVKAKNSPKAASVKDQPPFIRGDNHLMLPIVLLKSENEWFVCNSFKNQFSGLY